MALGIFAQGFINLVCLHGLNPEISDGFPDSNTSNVSNSQHIVAAVLFCSPYPLYLAFRARFVRWGLFLGILGCMTTFMIVQCVIVYGAHIVQTHNKSLVQEKDNFETNNYIKIYKSLYQTLSQTLVYIFQSNFHILVNFGKMFMELRT